MGSAPLPSLHDAPCRRGRSDPESPCLVRKCELINMPPSLAPWTHNHLPMGTNRRLVRLGRLLLLRLRLTASIKLRRLAKPDQGRPVLFVGDSLSQLWGIEEPLFFQRNNYVNRGKGGLTTAGLLRTVEDDILQTRPRCVHIICGINDIAENEGYVPPEIIVGNLRAVVKVCRTCRIEVIVASILPVSSIPWQLHLDPRDRVKCTNILLRKMCEEQDVTFLDYHSAMATMDSRLPAELTVDGLHLNALGYRRLGATLATEMPDLKVDG